METIITEQKTVFFSTGEQLSVEKDTLWLIISGVVKTYTYNQDGTIVTLGFWGNKDVVGKNLSKIRHYKTKCLSDVRAIPIPRSQWASLAREMIYCQQQTQQLIYIIHHTRVSQRLWLLLTWLGEKFGRMVRDGKLIDFQLTHQELAYAIGTTRITVTKILKHFEREDLIFRPKTKCIILKENS